VANGTALRRFAKCLTLCTGLLILAGSLVTSHDAGLSVPDWPTSYGWSMLTFPPSMWVANIFYEHVHRLIASTVGGLTIIMVVWLWVGERRRWLRWFAVAALGVVIAQGILGGITVLYFLPAAVSIAHAGLAEIVFCMTVAIALFVSRGWNELSSSPVDDARLRQLTTATTFAIYCQILVGATMRHSGAGLAIPDFPLMFGRLWPDHFDAGIGVHFVHRVGALVTASMTLATSVYVWRWHKSRRELVSPALVVPVFILIQITLGAATVLSGRQPLINSLHVVGGALVLTTSLILTLRSWQSRMVERVSSLAR
jgi:cytochrome c oxidase assembly protein subunit 15